MASSSSTKRKANVVIDLTEDDTPVKRPKAAKVAKAAKAAKRVPLCPKRLQELRKEARRMLAQYNSTVHRGSIDSPEWIHGPDSLKVLAVLSEHADKADEEIVKKLYCGMGSCNVFFNEHLYDCMRNDPRLNGGSLVGRLRPGAQLGKEGLKRLSYSTLDNQVKAIDAWYEFKLDFDRSYQ
jgi:hypothetical protein